MDRGARWATVHRVTKSQTRLTTFTFHFLSYSVYVYLYLNKDGAHIIKGIGLESPIIFMFPPNAFRVTLQYCVRGVPPLSPAPPEVLFTDQNSSPQPSDGWAAASRGGEMRPRSADKPSPAAVMQSARINSEAASHGWKDKTQAVFSHPLPLKVTTDQPLIQLKSL